MRPPSEPEINRKDPKKYYITWNHDVPVLLWHKYGRRRIRIKEYDNINRRTGDERERYAEERRKVWHYMLTALNYNPFEKELEKLGKLEIRKDVIKEVGRKQETDKIIATQLSAEDRRKLTPIRQAFSLWVENCKARTTNINSISTYRVTATWLTSYFEANGRAGDAISTITRLEIADALNQRKAERNWEATTYNNEYDTLINVFNWLKREEYLDKNPIIGTIEKLPTKKHKNKWYDPATKKAVKEALVKAEEWLVYRAMEFTYWTMIRSKTELMKLKAENIDRTLKRIHFPAELSKNGVECYRQYEPEFELVLDAIGFDNIPRNHYIFGAKGEPSEKKCHKDLIAERWRPVREALGLSSDFTVYGMKHTRIVHLMMKKVDGYDISYKARHEDVKSTKDYQRDYDLELTNVYGPEDLTF